MRRRMIGLALALVIASAYQIGHAAGDPNSDTAAAFARLKTLGRHMEAAEAFRSALALAGTEPERRFLTRRLAACQSST